MPNINHRFLFLCYTLEKIKHKVFGNNNLIHCHASKRACFSLVAAARYQYCPFPKIKNLGSSSACGAARGGGDETSKTDGELFDTEEPSRDT